MSSSLQNGITKHYGVIPDTDPEYWLMPNGPSWLWWILAIMPLDPANQVRHILESFKWGDDDDDDACSASFSP